MLATETHTGFSIVYGGATLQPNGDDRFPKIGKYICVDNDMTAHLVIDIPPIDNSELTDALKISPKEITEKYASSLAGRLEAVYETDLKVMINEQTGNVGISIPLGHDLSQYRSDFLEQGKRLLDIPYKDTNEDAKACNEDYGKNELENAFIFSKYDLVNAIPAQDLISLIETARDVTRSKAQRARKSLVKTSVSSEDTLAYFVANPESVSEIISETLPENTSIPEGGMKFSFAGTGRSGTFLKTTIPDVGDVVLGLRPFKIKRSMNPVHVQPLRQFMVGDIGVEITPALDTIRANEGHLKEVVAAVEDYVGPKGEQYYVDDPEVRNIGLAGNLPLYLDGDGIKLERRVPEDYTGIVPTDYVQPDGSFTQYHLFEKLHAAYDSPLHQQHQFMGLDNLKEAIALLEKDTTLPRPGNDIPIIARVSVVNRVPPR